MDTELFDALLYKLHETESLAEVTHPAGPSQFCRDCRARIEYLVPVVEDYLRERSWAGD